MLMKRPLLLPLASAAFLLAACESIIPSARTNISPVGQTLQVVAANGQASRMQFRPDGRVIAAFGDRSITGNWQMEDGSLCFQWGSAPRECWPYHEPFARGRTVTVTSSRGNVVSVTRL